MLPTRCFVFQFVRMRHALRYAIAGCTHKGWRGVRR